MLNFSLFKERFLTFKDDKALEVAQTAEAAEFQKRKDFFLEKLQALMPGGNLKLAEGEYPYSKEMKEFFEKLPDLSKANFETPEKKDGKLIVKYSENGEKKELVVEGPVYIALFWNELKAKLASAMFSGKNVSNALLLKGLESNAATPKFKELVAKLVKEGVDKVENNDSLVPLALAELDALRGSLSAESEKERDELKTELEAKKDRDLLKLDLERNKIQLPSSSLENEKFIGMSEVASEKFNAGFKPLELSIKIEDLKMDPKQWETTTDEMLNKIYVDWRALGIPVNEPFYAKMFSILRDASNPAKNKLLKNPDYLKWFRDPANNLVNIGKIAEDVGEDHDNFPKAFVVAYSHFSYVKNQMLAMGVTHMATLDAQRNLDRHSIADKPVDFLRTNYAKFSQAIREKDYATAGVYALGIYAIYKSFTILTKDKDGKAKYPNLGNWLFYGVAGYAGYVFAKNAGYDILKMAGLKDKDAEVRGTPMEAIAAMNLPEAQDLDYDVLLRVSEVKVDDLHSLYKKANIEGNNFIHPSQFPQIFPDLARVGHFPMGIGEEGLADSAGNTRKVLTPKQKEYIRVGRQLYKVMLVLRAAYNKTLSKEEGRSFEDAMRDPILKEAKIRHLCAIMGLYVFHTAEKGLLSSRAEEKAKEQLAVAFKAYGDNSIGFHLAESADSSLKKPGIYRGTIKGFPVYMLFNIAEKKFFVYLPHEYGGDDLPGRKTIAKIPIEGEAAQKEEVGKAVSAIDDRMEKLLNLVKVGSGRPEYDGVRWTAKVKMPGNPEFGINPPESMATITPMPDGNGLTVLMEGFDYPIDLDAANAERIPLTIGLLHEMFNNPDLDVFKPFHGAKMLSVTDPTVGDNKFTLKISKIDKSIDVKYNPSASPKFTIAEASQEQDLLKDPSFSRMYVEALSQNPNFELNKTFSNLENLITSVCPKGLFTHLGKIITGNTQGGSLSRFDVTSGGVPVNYTKMILSTAKYTLFGRLQKAVNEQKTFKGIESSRKSILADANNKFLYIHEAISKKNGELRVAGKAWDQTEFMSTVVNQLRLASTISGSYAFAQSSMEQSIYALDLPGLDGFDANKGAHVSAGKLMEVFAYHTSYLDNQEYEFASGKAVVGLDGLSSGPTPTPGISPPKEDPALRPHMVIRYFDYVRVTVAEKAAQLSSLSEINIPAPESTHWGILDFNRWAEEKGTYEGLDPLDKLPPMEHDPAIHQSKTADGDFDSSIGLTELDLYMISEHRKVVDYLLMELGPGILNMDAIDNYLKGNEDSDSEAGMFQVVEFEGKFEMAAWDKTDRIASTSRGKRSLQVQMVQQEIDVFVRTIYEAKLPNGKAQFIREQPGVIDRVKYALKKKWPTLFT